MSQDPDWIDLVNAGVTNLTMFPHAEAMAASAMLSDAAADLGLSELMDELDASPPLVRGLLMQAFTTAVIEAANEIAEAMTSREVP
jgi:hypothetical protein